MKAVHHPNSHNRKDNGVGYRALLLLSHHNCLALRYFIISSKQVWKMTVYCLSCFYSFQVYMIFVCVVQITLICIDLALLSIGCNLRTILRYVLDIFIACCRLIILTHLSLRNDFVQNILNPYLLFLLQQRSLISSVPNHKYWISSLDMNRHRNKVL